MGTPEYLLDEAIKLFSKIGFDGIEIIVQTDGYPCAIPFDATNDQVAEVKKMAENAGLAIAGLTPYLHLFNSLDEAARIKECDDLKRIIDMANMLDVKNIRIYGGKLVDGEEDPDGRKLSQLVKSMRECGDYCSQYGIRLCMENHFGTMTATAAQTAKIVKLINHPNVGILYDQANIAFLPAEEYDEAIELQKDKIFFVHCKDFVYRAGKPTKARFRQVATVDEDERTVNSRIPGQGILDWPSIFKRLKEIGYDGWVSVEYERRWQTLDLPEASIGMPQALNYIRSIIEAL